MRHKIVEGGIGDEFMRHRMLDKRGGVPVPKEGAGVNFIVLFTYTSLRMIVLDVDGDWGGGGFKPYHDDVFEIANTVCEKCMPCIFCGNIVIV